jgi:hypothetical protein
MSFRLKNTTLVKASKNLDGNIAVTGNVFGNRAILDQISVLRINKNGSPAVAARSIAVYKEKNGQFFPAINQISSIIK